jgi:Zn-dependent peptidase ImmA (M78 family)
MTDTQGQPTVRPAARMAAVEAIRDNLVDADGLVEFPISPIALAKKLGIRVSLSSSLGPGVSGVIVKEADEEHPRIYLAESDGQNRQNFTCAHELGHFFSRQYQDDGRYGYVDSRDDLSSSGTDSDERWANRFAAELLMPAFAVRKFFAEGMSLSKLAREFGVSTQAMEFRLRNLDLA